MAIIPYEKKTRDEFLARLSEIADLEHLDHIKYERLGHKERSVIPPSVILLVYLN